MNKALIIAIAFIFLAGCFLILPFLFPEPGRDFWDRIDEEKHQGEYDGKHDDEIRAQKSEKRIERFSLFYGIEPSNTRRYYADPDGSHHSVKQSRDGSAHKYDQPGLETFFGLIFAALGVVVGAFIYFLPGIVAFKKNRRQMAAIILLNFLAGWTIVGWVVAIVWAAVEDKPQPTQQQL